MTDHSDLIAELGVWAADMRPHPTSVLMKRAASALSSQSLSTENAALSSGVQSEIAGPVATSLSEARAAPEILNGCQDYATALSEAREEIERLKGLVAGIREAPQELPNAAALVTDCAPYLKDGETPRERMDRDFKDTQALTELLAEARRDRDIHNGHRRMAEAKLMALGSGAVVGGCVLVPVEPTDEMLAATCDDNGRMRMLEFTRPEERSAPFLVPRYAYRAMVQAARKANSALENGPAALADANTNPADSDLSSLRDGDGTMQPRLSSLRKDAVGPAVSEGGRGHSAPVTSGAEVAVTDAARDLLFHLELYDFSERDPSGELNEKMANLKAALVSGSREEQS